MRVAFNDECFGWLHDDRTFEPLPMPVGWRIPDYRGYQIELSRARQFPGATNVYEGDGAPTPTSEERAVCWKAYELARTPHPSVSIE